jgi:uncharacterized small protein (DUF1192 family)
LSRLVQNAADDLCNRNVGMQEPQPCHVQAQPRPTKHRIEELLMLVRYSDAELAAISDFMTASIAVLQAEIARLRAETPKEARG